MSQVNEVIKYLENSPEFEFHTISDGKIDQKRAISELKANSTLASSIVEIVLRMKKRKEAQRD